MTSCEFWGMTVYEMLERIAGMYGSRELFSYLDENIVRSVSYERFFRDVCVLAGKFVSLGLKGKRIVIDSRNTYEQIASLFAASSMGAVAVPLNFDLSEEDLWDAVRRLEPAMIIFDPEDMSLAEKVRPDGSYLVAAYDEEALESVQMWIEKGAGLFREVSGDPELPALILLTSGSTSRSKLVVLNHYVFAPHSLIETDRSILILPMFHVAGLNSLVNDMARGACICLSNMKNGLSDIQWFQPEDILSVPMFTNMLVKQHKKKRMELGRIKAMRSCGAPQNLEDAKYLDTIGIFSSSLYGTTEVSGTATYSTYREYRFGSVGKPGPWNQIRIAENGEVLIRGKTVMLGYLGDSRATETALDGGWFHTGDIGRLDEDGYLFITGRMKNIIILSNGENVSPEALEERLYRCAAIEEVVVYGEDDRLAAAVWCGESAGEKEKEEVSRFVSRYNKTMPGFQHIRRIVFRDKPFEKTTTGKIKRKSSYK